MYCLRHSAVFPYGKPDSACVGTIDKKIRCEDHRKRDTKIISVYLATCKKLFIKT